MKYERRCYYCWYPATGAVDWWKHIWEEHGGLLPDSKGRPPEPRGSDGRVVTDGRDGGRRPTNTRE